MIPICPNQGSALISLGLTVAFRGGPRPPGTPSALGCLAPLLLAFLLLYRLLLRRLLRVLKFEALLLLYIFALNDLIPAHGCKFHSYADDFQICISSFDLSLEHRTHKFSSLLDVSKTV